MRVVVALGGNALLKRGEPMTADRQRGQRADRRTCAGRHRGRPRAGALARQRSAGRSAGAPGGGVHRGGALSARRPRRADRGDDRLRPRAGARQRDAGGRADRHAADDDRGRPGGPGLRRPHQVRRADLHDASRPTSWRRRRRWAFKQDGDAWRRVVPSPEPKRIFEIKPIRWLLDKGVVVICAGGGGVPTMFLPAAENSLIGVEAVIDKDLASQLLAREVGADAAGHGHRRRRGLHRLGHPGATQARAGDRRPSCGRSGSRPGRWARRSMPRCASSRPPGSVRPSASLARDRADRRRHGRNPGRRVTGDDRRSQEEETMTSFGVHSEVGTLRTGDGPPP